MIKMDKRGKSLNLNEAFELFQSYNKAKNLTNDTIVAYRANYKYFTEFFREE